MKKEQIEAKFWELCKIANDEDRKNQGMTREFEGTLLDVLNLVKHNPEHEDVLKQCFIESWINENKKATHWIVLFCMRELRYPEVQEAINLNFVERGGPEGAPREMNFISDLNYVYKDSPWEDIDLFKYHWEREYPEKPWPY
ncbi:MAG: hypothetical protein AB2557_04045 [Candidatus Thiodiazotropha sp.]